MKTTNVSKYTIAYRIVTGIFCAAMLGSAIADLMHIEPMQESLAKLGYPEYLLSMLGVCKLAGAVVLLLPTWPTLKEWAYAGFTFDLLGATVSHIFIRDEIGETLPPAILLVLCAASYVLRRTSGRVG